jgi:NitT/TauT family transport system substrate-binding protein
MSAQDSKKITVAYIGITAPMWPALVARDKGFFKDEGLDVEWVATGQSAKVTQLVMAGGANIGNANAPDSARPIDNGADMAIFMNALAQGIHSLVGSKATTSVKDLKGKRVVVGGQKDITNLWWYALAKHYGLDPSKDVELLFSGSTGNRMAALASQGVDAAIIGPPASFQAFRQGFSDLGPAARFLGEFPMNVYIVNKSWAAKNKNAMIAFVRAMNRGTKYLLNPENKVEVSKILAKASGSSLEDSLSTYDLALKVGAFAPDGSISSEGLKRLLDKLAEDGDLKAPLKPASVFYDRQYIDAAQGAQK